MLVTWNGNGAPRLQQSSAAPSGMRGAKGNLFPGQPLFKSPGEIAGPGRFVNFHRDSRILEFGVDPLGMDNLFFWIDRGTLFLSDALDSLLSLFCQRGVHPVIPRDALLEMLIFRFNSGERTLVKGIRRAEAGQTYRCDEHLHVTRKPYWTLDFADDYRKASDSLLVDEFDHIFAGVLKSYAIEDPATIAVALTGGVDSCYIQSHMNDLYGKGLFSFCMVYKEDGDRYDESAYALSGAAAFDTRHTLYTMTRDDFLASIAETVRASGYPLTLVHTAQNFWTQQQLPPGPQHILSGFAADAVFGSGIGKFWLARKLSPDKLPTSPVLPLLERTGGQSLRLQAHKLKGYWGRVEHVEDALACWPELDSPVDFALVRQLLTPEEIAAVWEPRLRYLQGRNFRSIVDIVTSLKFYGLGATVASQNAAARSLGKEIFFPYYDRRILEFTKDIHPDQRLRHWGLTTKYLLKKAAMRRVPEFIVKRKKRSGELPINEWMRAGLFDRLLSDHAQADLGLDYDRLKRLALQPGKFNDFLLWSYVNTVLWKESWLRRFGPVEVAAA